MAVCDGDVGNPMLVFLRARVSALVVLAFATVPLVLGGTAKHAHAEDGLNSFSKRLKTDFNVLRNDLLNSDLGRLIRDNTPNNAHRNTSRSLVSTGAKPKVTTSRRPKARFDTVASDPMDPRSLGKLRGAIQSSPRAKAAHIASGQYAKGTGPVSLAAALAVADYKYGKAAMAFDWDRADAQATLDLTQSIAAAQALVDDGGPTQDEIGAAQTILGSTYSTEAQKLAAQALIEKQDAVAEALDLLDNATPPSQVDVDAATAMLEAEPPSDAAVIAAEDALLALYQGEFPTSDDPENRRLSDEAQKVIDAVRASNPSRDVVGSLLATHAASEARVALPSSQDDDTDAGLLEREKPDSSAVEDGSIGDDILEEDTTSNG